MIKNKYDNALSDIIKNYFPNITEEELKENEGFFREIIDGLPQNKINNREDSKPLFELTFTDKDNLIYKVYYYSHLYGKNHVFKKVTLDGEKYFSLLEDDLGFGVYNKERSYYCGKHIWEKEIDKELYKITSMFIHFYKLKLFNKPNRTLIKIR